VVDDSVMISSDMASGEDAHAIVTSDEGTIKIARGYYEGSGYFVT